jgi:hypothetical protein
MFEQTIYAMVTSMWESLVNFLPDLLASVAIIIFGWIFAVIVEKVIKKAMRGAKVDVWSRKVGLEKALFGSSLTSLSSKALKWYIVIVTLSQASLSLGLMGITDFVNSILLWVPNAIVGMLMVVGGLAFASFVSEGVRKQEMIFSDIGASVAYGVIIYFAIVLALPKFGFENVEILVDAFVYIIAGISAGIAIAIGLAFGLALREPIEEIIKRSGRKKRKR